MARQFNLDDDTHELLRQESFWQNTTMINVLREALRMYVEVKKNERKNISVDAEIQ